MKYAIISDIHANCAALNAVLEDARKQGCDQYACLGDIIGYGRQPRECIKIVQALACPTVMGNFEHNVLNEQAWSSYNPVARRAFAWMQSQLSREELVWLRRLPLVETVESFTIVHASLREPETWPYVFEKKEAAASLSNQQTTLCFNGHTHIPIAFVQSRRDVKGGLYAKIQIEPGHKYLINVGSVGQPRDHNPHAAYVIFDMRDSTVELRRVPTDTLPVGPWANRG